jgi:hypothetical protein
VRKVIAGLALAGLLLAGFAGGQFTSRYSTIERTNPANLAPIVRDLMDEYEQARQGIGNAAQVTQVTGEVNLALQYVQVRQNAEIIRLLKKLANEP